jgi:hypothetical protein
VEQVNIKIDKEGQLHIERRGAYVMQMCRRAGFIENLGANKEVVKTMPCSHTCPLFGEPEYDIVAERDRLHICGVTLLGVVVDERGKA